MMQLKSLTIRRRESYENNGGQLLADAIFDGPGGTINLELAPGFIVRVLALIEEDAAERAKRLASAVQTAMIDAIDTARLVQADAKPLALTDESEIPF